MAKQNFDKMLDEINRLAQPKTYGNINELQINRTYIVKSLDRSMTQFGLQTQICLMDEKDKFTNYNLPKRYTSILSDDFLTNYKREYKFLLLCVQAMCV